jgi:hypothetical protein
VKDKQTIELENDMLQDEEQQVEDLDIKPSQLLLVTCILVNMFHLIVALRIMFICYPEVSK